MYQHRSVQHSSPDNPGKIHVTLPDEPPDVSESVAAALLHLLRTMITDPNQAHPDAGDT